MPLKRVVPTKFTVPILRNPRPGNFEKSVAESDPKKKFDETRRGKETTSDVKKNSLGDFERFKASMTKKQVSLCKLDLVSSLCVLDCEESAV